jgi:ubiquinone/menaquinone biosynthesis C-methylase UbiE
LFWWETSPKLQKLINVRISGDPEIAWVEHTLATHLADRLPLQRCLSLGCGTGRLERALAQHSAFCACDAYDVADGSLEVARRMAAAGGHRHINYHSADVNALELPADCYDVVWVHDALHHLAALEDVFAQIRRSLRPGGLLVFNEYVGPDRFQFPGRQKEIADLCFRLLPLAYRQMLPEAVYHELSRTSLQRDPRWLVRRAWDKARDGDLLNVLRRRVHALRASRGRIGLVRAGIVFPTTRDVIAADPSEAIRSSEILPLLRRQFEIIELRPWGGNILQFLLAGIAGNFQSGDPQAGALLGMLMEIEGTLLRCGEFESDFAYGVARPRN